MISGDFAPKKFLFIWLKNGFTPTNTPYVLALKGNQGTLHEDVRLYLSDPEVRQALQASGQYNRTLEKARSQIEIREYYQTEVISWLNCKKEWKGLKSIGMEEKTIRKDGMEKKEYRFFISSLKADIELFSRAVRGHWSVESMHWHLDVTFREDANQTLDRLAAQNLNIIRKWCLSILKVLELFRPNLSMKKKRFIISMDPPQFLVVNLRKILLTTAAECAMITKLTICCCRIMRAGGLYAGVAQWPGHQPSKLGMRVRFSSPAPKYAPVAQLDRATAF